MSLIQNTTRSRQNEVQERVKSARVSKWLATRDSRAQSRDKKQQNINVCCLLHSFFFGGGSCLYSETVHTMDAFLNMVLWTIQIILSADIGHLIYFLYSQLILILVIYDFGINKEELRMWVTILFIIQKP